MINSFLKRRNLGTVLIKPKTKYIKKNSLNVETTEKLETFYRHHDSDVGKDDK